MSQEQLLARLSVLAGKCGLLLLREPHLLQGGTAAAETSASGALHDTYLEFSALVMTAMLWDSATFCAIMNTNLDTLQPFGDQPLPQQHWLDALQKLQLTEDQLRVLSCMHGKHHWAGVLSLSGRIDVNMQQQAVHTESLLAVVQQQPTVAQDEDAGANTPAASCGAVNLAQASSLTDSPSTTSFAPTDSGSNTCSANKQACPLSAAAAAASPACTAAAGSGSSAISTSSRKDPTLQVNALLEHQEALAEEQCQMMRKWLLLGIHVGIITACTLSTHQQVRVRGCG